MPELPLIDLAIILAAFVLLILSAVRMGRFQTGASDYFLGNKQLPWWAICGSVVATETSTLTFIGAPAISFFGNLHFVQLLLGYIIGRFIVARLFLPRYINGEMATTYTYLEHQLGAQSRRFTSVLFLITRLLGDGVRLFATALPLKLLTGWDLWTSLVVILIITITFSLIGGITTIIWTDFVQLLVYMTGATIAVGFLLNGDWSTQQILEQIPSDKWAVLNFDFDLSTAYTFYWALIGGILLTLSSHGTDQLIVQRVLCAGSLDDARKTMTTSGIVVAVQMSFFLFIGLLLYGFYQLEAVDVSGLNRNEIFPHFIVTYLPEGITGVVIASVFAAAISTLSSSLNSMASSIQFDLMKTDSLRTARKLTVATGIALGIMAALFQQADENVISLGLSIASILYGGILGGFVIGILNWKLSPNAAMFSMGLGIITVLIIWLTQLIGGVSVLGWTLFIPVGLTVTLTAARLLRRDAAEGA